MLDVSQERAVSNCNIQNPLVSSCEPKPLLKALTLLSPFTAGGRTTLPILGCCLLSGDTVTVNDLENEISLTVDGLQVEGVILVPLKVLKNALPAKTNRSVSLKIEQRSEAEYLVVDGSARIPMFDVAEWPMTGDLGETQGLPFMVPRELALVSLARSQDESRPPLCDVLLSPKRSLIAASDGHRAHRSKLEFAGMSQYERIVSGDLIPLLSKLPDLNCQFYETVADPENPQRALVQRVIFFNDTTLILTRPVDAEFPDIEQVMKKYGHDRVVVSKAALVPALEQCRKFTTERSRGVQIDLTPTQMKLSVNDPDTGKIEQTVSVTSPWTVSFGLNVNYLLDVLKTNVLDKVGMWIAVDKDKGEVNAPVLFLDDQIHAAIMPMRVF